MMPCDTAENLEQSVAECFQKQAEHCHFRTAIGGTAWQPTYGELNVVADRLAGVLLGQGGEVGDRAAILMRHDAPLIAVVLAVLKAGKIVVVLNPTDPPARLAQVLADAEPAMIFTDLHHQNLAAQIADGQQSVVCFDDHFTDAPVICPGLKVDPGSVAFLVYTSGSTGRPKGVMRTHRDLLHQVLRFTKGLGLGASDKVSLLASLSGGQGMITTLCALLNGAAICPFPVTDIGVTGLVDWMVQHRITDYFSSASLFRHFMKTLPPGFKFPDVRLVRLSSEPATSADFAMYREHFNAECFFYHTFSSSETGNICQCRLTHDAQVSEGRLPAGRTAEGVEVLLLSESGEEVADGKTGEIMVRSRHLSAGYWRNEALTRSRFSKAESSGGVMIFRSGDLGRRLADGQIMIVGRGDDRVKVRGYRIEVSEIEDALQTHAGVERAVVMTSARENEDLRLVAFVTLRAGGLTSAEELRQSLRTMVPGHMIPTRFIFLENLPLTPHGKIDRAQLKELAAPDAAMTDVEEPATETEVLLAGIWKQVFSREDIGRDADFFELGGDSLVAVVIAANVHAVLRVELTLVTFSDHPKLAALAQEIDGLAGRNESSALPPLMPAPRDVPLPLSFQQERIWRFSQSREQMASYIKSHHCRFRGNLNVAALRESLAYVAERHEILRTTFEEICGRPVQIVHPPEPVAMTELDFSRCDQPEAEAMKARRAEATRPMDLKRGPVLRFILSRLREGEFWLQTVHHHLISDGWSWHVFFRELGLIYDHLVQGQPPPLPRNQALHYGDYAHRQRLVLRPGSEAWQKMLAWWRGVLSDAASPSELPFRRRVGHADAAPGEGHIWREVADATTRNLERIGQEESATFYAVRMAAWSALLAKATAQPDIVLGAYVSDRHDIKTQGMFGYFANPSQLRLRCDETQTFRQWLRIVRRVINETQAQAWLPFDQLCEELVSEGITPPGIKMIVRTGNRRDAQSLHGVVIDWPGRAENLVMPWGFTLSFVKSAAGEKCGAGFDARIYDPSGAGEMLGSFVRLLDEISRQPDAALSALLDAAGVCKTERVGGEFAEPRVSSAEMSVPDDPLDAERFRIAQLLHGDEKALKNGVIAGLMRPEGPFISALRNDPRRAEALVPKQRASMLAEMNSDCLYQFYGVEHSGEKSFRWSQSISAVKVHPPRHSNRVTLRLHPFVPPAAPPALWLEGHPLAFLSRQGLRLEYHVPEKCIPAQPAWLVILAPPFQSPDDTRLLGVPLHRIKFDTLSFATS